MSLYYLIIINWTEGVLIIWYTDKVNADEVIWLHRQGKMKYEKPRDYLLIKSYFKHIYSREVNNFFF